VNGEVNTPICRAMVFKCDVEWMRRAGVRGVVIGNTVLFADSPVPKWLFRHELEHAYQQIREGVIRFYLKYFYYSLRYGYQDNPFEVEARARQNDPLTTIEEQLLWKLNEDSTKLQSV
jgi:hypothetical protein